MSRQFNPHQPKRPTALNGGGLHLNGGPTQNGDLYQQLLSSSDLVKELDDIEAISQQISQHAEVLYQNWAQSQQPKPAASTTAYGAGVGAPKRHENGVSPLSSPTATLTSPSFVTKATGQKIDLLPEVNGNLKDLVNSFVSTDRAKQAARMTIASTISNQMNKKNGGGVRSPSPTSSGSSPFSSRGVSPLRSPMLASSLALSPGAGPGPPPSLGTERRLMDAFPTNASIMNSVHTKMPPLFSPPSSAPSSPAHSMNSHAHHGPELVRIPVQHLPSSNGTSLKSPSMISHSTTASTTSIPSLHAAHVENMKKRFEEAKERINAMHQRATANSLPFLANHADPFDEIDFFSRNRRPARPLMAPPHPELTPQQRQHISERSIPLLMAAPGIANNNNQLTGPTGAPPKRFGGSVAERVMIFERCPVFGSSNEAKSDHSLQNGKPVNNGPLTNVSSGPSAVVGNSSATPWKHLQQEGLGKAQTPRAKVGRDIPISTLTFPSVASPAAATPSKPSSAISNAITPPSLQVLTTPSSFLQSSPSTAVHPVAAVFSPPTLTPTSRASSASTSPASTLSRVSRPPSIIVTGKEKVLPKFHFPLGNPATGPSGDLTKFADEFRKHKNSTVSIEELGQVLKACGYPLYWKGILFAAAGGDKTGLLSYVAFSDFWRKLCASHHDEAAQFMHVVTCKSGKNRNAITPEEFVPLVQDVVDTHPGLGFLKEATEFHSRYVHTVIARIFFVVNRSWSGFITLSELRRSNFLATLRLLEEEDDINQITDFFSYEHFYVIYCKFWELDKDHDLFIDREDLARHNDHAISARMIDRIFSGAVTRGAAQQEGKMSYTEFVWFLLAEEDKRAPTSIEYWFRCMDLDGDGVLSMYELEYFYEEQLQRMEQLGIETLPFEDCLCQMLDMIMPKKPNVISLQDMKSCRMTPIFFDTFFNLEKYLDHEQRDPFASQRDVDEEGNEMSDWDRFAAEEYELLVAEEGNADGMDDMCYEDDLDVNAEMQLEQALDENDLVYHDTMISTAS